MFLKKEKSGRFDSFLLLMFQLWSCSHLQAFSSGDNFQFRYEQRYRLAPTFISAPSLRSSSPATLPAANLYILSSHCHANFKTVTMNMAKIRVLLLISSSKDVEMKWLSTCISSSPAILVLFLFATLGLGNICRRKANIRTGINNNNNCGPSHVVFLKPYSILNW